MHAADDSEILQVAVDDGRVIVSADIDFGDLLASSNAADPSVLLLRRQDRRRAAELAALILANLDEVAEDLESGAIVVLGQQRIRVRRLPIRPRNPKSSPATWFANAYRGPNRPAEKSEKWQAGWRWLPCGRRGRVCWA